MMRAPARCPFCDTKTMMKLRDGDRMTMREMAVFPQVVIR
jgi:DNA-directed RNA polymerase subunit RPC12/RpoP